MRCRRFERLAWLGWGDAVFWTMSGYLTGCLTFVLGLVCEDIALVVLFHMIMPLVEDICSIRGLERSPLCDIVLAPTRTLLGSRSLQCCCFNAFVSITRPES